MRTILHGDFLWSKGPEELTTQTGYLVANDGVIEDLYPVLPEKYAGHPVTEHKGAIVPAFCDLHVHASQYVERGLGMDLLLSDWLNEYTFPQEARFADPAYAEPIYDAFIDDLILHGTFAVSAFATIHRGATSYLIRRMEEKGLYGYIGKVNMNCGAPDYLTETTAESLRETEQFLEEFSGNRTAKPILTPRFAPTCTEELMRGLGLLAARYGVGLQTHLVESRWEASAALEGYPDCACDTEIYERAGLMDHGPVIGAHFIFPSAKDIEILKRHNGVAVHCPDATVNIIAGIMETGTLQDRGVAVALGSDIGGGHNIGVCSQAARAVQLSKLKHFYEPENNRQIGFANAFHLLTRGGGQVFGKLGAFEPGYILNALVLDGLHDPGIVRTPAEIAERFCYIGTPANITARYLSGKRI
ncbi:MAG: amidohydrolase family protein [Clostridia bacterium]|nr:amidohydrolase family protein [Clostridia bacterium]